MNDINFQVFDKNSGLPFPEFSDIRVRELAQKFNKSYSEIFYDIKAEIDLNGVSYVIHDNSKSVVPILNDCLNHGSPVEYDTYEEALKELNYNNDFSSEH